MVEKPRQIGRRPVADAPLTGLLCSARLPLVYANLPKSGCTTIKNIMYAIDNGRWLDDPLAIHGDRSALVRWQPGDPEGSRRLLRRRLDERAISFTFVRHPGRRAYSTFNEKIFAVHPHSFPRIREYLERNFGASFSVADYTIGVHRDNFRKYLNFVRANIAGKTAVRKDPHWLPQTEILRSWRRRGVPIDFIGRLEHFKAGMRYILDVCGYAEPIDLDTRHNEGPPAPFAYDELADNDIRDLIYDVFRQDFEQLHYFR